MKRTVAGIIALGVAGLAVALASGAASAGGPGDAVPAGLATGRPVVVIGVAGLRWSDISATATPAIWRLASAGSVGSLAVTAIKKVTCPDDAWLTLNSGARSAVNPSDSACRAVPVVPGGFRPAHAARPELATIPAMPGIVARNSGTGYQPAWGTLARAVGPGGCSTAIGPGAALALADRAGRVKRYQPAMAPAGGYAAVAVALRQCPLTVIDLGTLRPGGSERTRQLAAADRAIGQISAAAPAGARIVLAGLGDDGSPHLRALVVSGPGYRAGLLTSASTRQPGIVAITDLTPSILRWRGRPAGSSLAGAPVLAGGRGALSDTVAAMIGQDTADQVYRSIVGWFFLYYGVAEAVIFAIIALVLRGDEAQRVRRRVAWYTRAAAFGAAVPAGTFLAGLLPWAQWPHPALWLYGLGLAWAAIIAVPAVTGPWQRDPFGPPGFVCAVTLAVIGIDVMTGSELQLGAPFGLSLVEAGRYYGIGNNALGVYATAGVFTAAWAAAAVILGGRPGARRAAVAAAGAVAAVTVMVSGWPGFGAKVGGTIAMVPAFLVLLAAVAGIRITLRRALLIAASGFALVAAFAMLNYLGIAAPSHQGDFIRQLLAGQAGGTLNRKISSNLRSVTLTWYTLIPPVVALGAGLMLAFPARLRLRTYVTAGRRWPLVRTTLAAVWLAAVLSWFLEDSGVSVVAAALPVALPLGITLAIRAASMPPLVQPANLARTGQCGQTSGDGLETGAETTGRIG